MPIEEFKDLFITEIKFFASHVHRVSNQHTAQKELKKNLLKGRIVVHIDFAEDYACRSQDEVQTAYFNMTQVTLHPVVIYFKHDDSL